MLPPIGIFVLAPGAFFVLAALTALQNLIKIKGTKKGKDMSKIQSGCGQDCLHCTDKGCPDRLERPVKAKRQDERSSDELEFLDVDEEGDE